MTTHRNLAPVIGLLLALSVLAAVFLLPLILA
jgi:hypothetical protein